MYQASPIKSSYITCARAQERKVAFSIGEAWYTREDLHDAWARYLPASHFPKEVEPVEPVEPGPGKVPEVPEVPDAMGSVRCRDCAYFDPDESLCLKLEQSVDSTHTRACADFSVPL